MSRRLLILRLECGMRENTGESRSGCAMMAVGGLVLLPLLYLLAIGPTAWLIEQEWISESFAERLYAPILMLIDLSPFCQRLFEWYLDLWT